MVSLHLAGKVLFKPFVFLYEVVDELDGKLALDLYCRLAVFGIVEPCLCEPPDTESVGIDADNSWYVKTLDINIPVGKWVNQSLAQYGLLIVFFFKSSERLDKKIC